MFFSGIFCFGWFSVGLWLVYGFGCEFENFLVYVVLMVGCGSSGGVLNWLSGFLLLIYEGVLFWSGGEFILNLDNLVGIDCEM